MRKTIYVFILFLSAASLPRSATALEARQWLYGSMIGLGVGAGAGVGIGYAVCDNPRGSGSFCTNRAAGMTYLGVGLGALGFGVGGVINYTLTKDKPEKSAALLPAGALYPSLWIDPEGGGGLAAAMAF